MATIDLDIQPLTPDRLPDLATLFAQGGDPKWCWCAYFRVRGTDFSAGSGARHRKVLEDATRAGEEVGHAPGLVAYRDGKVVARLSAHRSFALRDRGFARSSSSLGRTTCFVSTLSVPCRSAS